MARVDDNRDARRAAEQKATEAAAQKKGDERRAERFRAMMDKGREASQERSAAEAKGEARSLASKQQGREHAASALMARQGMVANKFAAELQRQGMGQVSQTHDEAISRSEDLVHDRSRKASENETHAEEGRSEERQLRKSEDRLAPISRDDRRESSGGGQKGGGSMAEGGGDQPSSEVLLGGASAKPAGNEAAAAQQTQRAAQLPAQLQEMIATMVKHVMAGVDKKGLGVMQVDLKDDVLAGSRLLITAGEGGVHLKISTHDESTRRLLSAGQTTQELSFGTGIQGPTPEQP